MRNRHLLSRTETANRALGKPVRKSGQCMAKGTPVCSGFGKGWLDGIRKGPFDRGTEGDPGD